MSQTTTISVTGDAGYDIVVGRGILERVGDVLAPTVRKVLVVHPPTLGAAAAQLRSSASAGER
jgi:3-dehydroquinate synthase